MISMGLGCDPKLMIADEPTTALDVTVQAQLLDLLKALTQDFGMALIIIAHDLSVVRHISTRISVMYLGKIVEIANRIDLHRNPFHPYTRALLSAVPIPNPKLEKKREHIVLKGEIPSPLNPPRGCSFHPRCPKVMPICSQEDPVLREIESGHWASCHLYND